MELEMMIERNCKVIKHLFTSNMPCFGCGFYNNDKFIKLFIDDGLRSPEICIECYNENIYKKRINCYRCDKLLKINFTQLKLGDDIQGGIFSFCICLSCLINNHTTNIGNAVFDLTYDDDKGYFDTWDEEYEYSESDFENLEERNLHEIFYVDTIKIKNKKISKNIREMIYNCKSSDKKKNFNVGNITHDCVLNLLKEQQNKCYICNDIVLTHSYIPYCCYKFSIDRLDNSKPHNIDNVKISCYFCNCKNHPLYNKKEKIKCENNICLCNNI